MTSTALQTYDQHSGALTLAQAQGQYNALVEFTKSVLKDGLDYGKVPGVSKPSLLKPGAEKLATLYRLRPSFELVTSREDWDGGFFYYHYRCKLTRDGEFMGEAEGSCNTKEKKYRYRNAERVCPNCGKPTIIKGKAEFGGGYICFAKKGGCGAKFKEGDAAIEGQEVGQVENPEIYDTVNTVQKMAQKRALVAAVLITTGASEFFTQDVEDLQVVNVEYAPASAVVQQEAKAAPAQAAPQVRHADVTREVAQAAGVQPQQSQGNPVNAEALKRVRDMAARVQKYGEARVEEILGTYDWQNDMTAAAAVYADLKQFGLDQAALEAAKAPQAQQGDVVEGQFTPDAPVSGPLTTDQIGKLQAAAKGAGADTSEKRAALWAWILQRPEPVGTTSLTSQDAVDILQYLVTCNPEQRAQALGEALGTFKVATGTDAAQGDADDLPF